MKPYHKIQTVFKRDPETKFKTLLEGQYSLPEFEYLADNLWHFTEKVDGTNIRIWQDESGLTRIGGRTDNAQIPVPLTNHIMDHFADCDSIPEGLCLYGEGYGGKIQKAGATYGGEQRFVLFDVCTIDAGMWLQRQDVMDIGCQLGLKTVPIIGIGTLHSMVKAVRGGLKSEWGDFTAEGIVARPTTELRLRRGERAIAKLKCKDFPA